MRYFIFYPPTKSVKLIDIDETVRVQDVLETVRKKFGLKNHPNDRSEISIVLSYNGFDLKPKWSFGELNIPSGAIIHCTYKEQQAANLYIYCGFNKKLLKLFDSSITLDTTIGTIRTKISNQLGLPLSTFCLETLDGKQRLYDQMKLIDYDIKIHDQLYLKVWKGYEKFLSACIRGYAERYSHDDLTRYYQMQVTLYIAAFYGHMELATTVMQHGARSDRPVGEHPSRQWSSETINNILPEALKCPIHIAIERGHVKMVDLFVRQSVLCTQIPEPVTGYLPYKLALSCSLSVKTKEERRCFSEIHFYLHDKQYNLKIPLNANGEYVSNLLTSTTTPNTIRRGSTHHVNVSLPFYCRLISWYERARERAWKKFSGYFYTKTQTKRVYPKQGLLGYKVLIDGYNHTFEVPLEQRPGIRPSDKSQSIEVDPYIGCSNEEREKIIRTKMFMKQSVLDERQRTKQIAALNLQQERRKLLLSRQTSTNGNRYPMPTTAGHVLEGISSSSDFSSTQLVSSLSPADMKVLKSMLEVDKSSINSVLSTELINSIPIENNHQSQENPKRKSKTHQKVPRITLVNEDNKPTIPAIISPITHSSLSNNLEIIANGNKQAFQPAMSSVDAFSLSSTRLASEIEQRRATKRHELFTQIEHTLQQQQPSIVSSTPATNPRNDSFLVDSSSILDIDSYIPLPDHPNYLRSSPAKSRLDLKIHHTTIQSYERYSNVSMRSTAINCLQEAGYFKRKSWLKQVEISQEMMKNKVQRHFRCPEEKPTKIAPLRATHTTTPYKTNPVKVN